MTKRTSAKHKIDRRMGENIWGRAKSPVNRREYGPGQHGQRRKGKTSDFGLQLRAKQKLKGYYGDLSEKQFSKIYDEASRVLSAAAYRDRPTSEILYHLADAEWHGGRLASAQKTLDQCLALDPEHAPSRALRAQLGTVATATTHAAAR
jgi:predicted Zn-dependent protease